MSARKQKKNKRKASTTLKQYPQVDYDHSAQTFNAEDIKNLLEDRGSFDDEDYIWSEDSDLLDNDYDDKEYYGDDYY